MDTFFLKGVSCWKYVHVQVTWSFLFTTIRIHSSICECAEHRHVELKVRKASVNRLV